MMFSIEEISLMNMYSHSEKKELIKELKNTYPYIPDEDKEMKELVESVIRKLMAISDDKFANIDFTLAISDIVL
jgi:hypothetical protein